MHYWTLLIIGFTIRGAAAQNIQLGGSWIPTDLNYGVLSDLRQNKLQSLPEQIAGYSTLGIIPSETVASWLSQLINNPSFREGTVRWKPNDYSKCNSKSSACTKSIHITILEFDYVDPNATDCNATALVAADALLPPSAVVTNGNFQYWPQGPVQYEVIRAPNSTAGNCTYVVQYPPATQTLANTLCSQQSGSCFNSACVPCNANQSIATSDNPSGCTDTSGVAPALVAAIEGAAQCLVQGGVGAFQCQVAYIANATACSQMHCFPGNGEVVLEGGRSIKMQDLQIGDRVQVVTADGHVSYDDVYFFGHRAMDAVGSFLQLSLEPKAAGSGLPSRVLELSAKHWLPIGQVGHDYSAASMKQARHVAPGDTVWALHGDSVKPYTVSGISEVSRQGLWAPYTSKGTIVVNGVVASVHSEWVLDGLLEYMGWLQTLPAIYQVLLSPVRLAYMLAGASAFRNLDSKINFGEILSSPYISSTAHMLFMATIFLVMFPLGQKMGRGFAKRLSSTGTARVRKTR